MFQSLLRGPRFRMGIKGLTILCVATMASSGWAQRPAARQKVADPEVLTLETKGLPVQLAVTYYPGPSDKQTVPVILLHDWEGNRNEYAAFARYLQEQGRTVIAPDLRGHGDSIRVRGVERTLDRERFNATALAAMGEDIETCKRFLMEKNNAGELNIEMLTVVAAGETCVLAGLWAAKDWSWPMVAGRKQGQDVKALVFLSPTRAFKNLNLNRTMRDLLFTGGGPVEPLSILIAVGANDADARRDARTLYENFNKRRPPLNLSSNPQEAMQQQLEQQSLYLEEYDVDFQGTSLVDPRRRLNLYEKINQFIEYRLSRRAEEFPWHDRSP